jgi:hypothetical protein
MPATGARVELYLGGVWTDITADVYARDPIAISRGRRAWGSAVDPGACTLTINNKGGKYSRRNPLSPYYGQLTRNTPIRISTTEGVRCVMEVSAWPRRWDVSGGDVWVPVQAAGILRRLGRGDPLRSALYRSIVGAGDPGILAYWPMEDSSGSTHAASAFAWDNEALLTSGLSYAADSSLPGSDALPTVGQSGSLAATVHGFGAEWRVEFMWRLGAAPTATVDLLTVTTGGTFSTWTLRVTNAGTFQLTLNPADGGALQTLTVTPPAGAPLYGVWQRTTLQIKPSGSDIAYLFQAADDIDQSGWFTSGTLTGATGGAVRRVSGSYGSAASGLALGHLAVYAAYDATVSSYRPGPAGYAGETALARLARLCAEEDVSIVLPGGTDTSAAMGAQRPASLLELLQECADADRGILGEDRTTIALAYTPRTALYNRAATLALDYNVRGEVAPPIEPDDDDVGLANDVTVSRVGGSSARATLDEGPLSTQAPPNGVGRYAPSAVALNVASDAQLPDLAAWLLHEGTWDEERITSLTVDLAAGPWLRTAAAAVDAGHVVTVANPPAWLAYGSLAAMVQGYAEVIGVNTWTITYATMPAGPYTVGVLDSTVLGRLDTDGSELAAAVTATDTVLSISVTAGPQWTMDPAHYPINLVLGGEEVTARAPGAALDAIDGTFESGVGGWTPTGCTFAASTAQAHLGSHSGLITVVGSPTQAFVRPDAAHYAPATAGAQYRHTVWVYAPVALPSVVAAIDWHTSGKVYVSTSSGSATAVPAGVWTPLTVTAAAPGTAAYARCGPTINSSPAAGTQLHVDDIATVATATYTGNPQSMTVIRGVNGVAKFHNMTNPVSLAQPLVLAL